MREAGGVLRVRLAAFVTAALSCAACAGAGAASAPPSSSTSATGPTAAQPAPNTTEKATTASADPATNDAAAVTTSLLAANPPATATTTTKPMNVSTTPTPTTVSTEPVWPRRVTMAFSGDVLPHSPLWRQAERNAAAAGREGYDFGPMLAELAPIVTAADVGVCHLETPIAPEGEEFSTMPRYGVPPEIIGAIARAGYDRCSTASNHTIDRGFAGIVRTVDTFDAYGVAQSGMARTPDEIDPRVFEVDTIAISHLAYTWSYNGLILPDGDEWQSALIDPDRILADVEAARALGARIVIVSLHWGAEGEHRPTHYQLDIAEQLTASGTIDLIVGHHAHVLQPIAQVNGTWVLFGLGNILSNLPTSDRWPAASQDAAVVTTEFTIDESGRAIVARPVVHPTWVDQDAGWVVRDVMSELERDDLSAGQRGRLEASLQRTRSVVGEFIAGST